MEWPTLGWLIGSLGAIAVPVVVIFIVLWIIRRETIRKQDAVRSPEYWEEEPDGRKYPTGWHPTPGPISPGQGAQSDGPPGEGQPEPEREDPSSEGGGTDDPRQGPPP
ncbi:hypothetical protein [Nocardiopsis nanhaiensis]